MLTDLADVLERILRFGPEPEFDPEKQYEIRAVGKSAIGKVIVVGELLRFEFVSGEAPELISSARDFPIPWQFDFLSDEGTRKQTKNAKVTQVGMSNGVLWMIVQPTKFNPAEVSPYIQKGEPVKLAAQYLVIDGTEGAIKLRPLTFYHSIFEKAYNVSGLPSWHATEDKVQSMREALARLNTIGRFEIFAYPDEREKYVEAAPEELKARAKEMAGL